MPGQLAELERPTTATASGRPGARGSRRACRSPRARAPSSRRSPAWRCRRRARRRGRRARRGRRRTARASGRHRPSRPAVDEVHQVERTRRAPTRRRRRATPFGCGTSVSLSACEDAVLAQHRLVAALRHDARRPAQHHPLLAARDLEDLVRRAAGDERARSGSPSPGQALVVHPRAELTGLASSSIFGRLPARPPVSVCGVVSSCAALVFSAAMRSSSTWRAHSRRGGRNSVGQSPGDGLYPFSTWLGDGDLVDLGRAVDDAPSTAPTATSRRTASRSTRRARRGRASSGTRCPAAPSAS